MSEQLLLLLLVVEGKGSCEGWIHLSCRYYRVGLVGLWALVKLGKMGHLGLVVLNMSQVLCALWESSFPDPEIQGSVSPLGRGPLMRRSCLLVKVDILRQLSCILKKKVKAGDR